MYAIVAPCPAYMTLRLGLPYPIGGELYSDGPALRFHRAGSIGRRENTWGRPCVPAPAPLLRWATLWDEQRARFVVGLAHSHHGGLLRRVHAGH